MSFSATIDPRNAQLTSRTPTLEERFVDWLNSTFYGDDREGRERAERITNVVKMTPARIPFSAYDAGRALGSNDYVSAALNAVDVTPGGMSKAIIIGVASPKFPKKALEKAIELEKRGFDNEVIKSNTQVYRGADGHWRFDLPLGKDEFALKRTLKPNERALFPEVVDAPTLLAAEPKFANVLVDSSPRKNSSNPASFYPSANGRIEIQPELIGSMDRWYENPSDFMGSGQRIMAHEASHGIDYHQGMDPGWYAYDADLLDFVTKRANPDTNFISMSGLQSQLDAMRMLQELNGPQAHDLSFYHYLSRQNELNARHAQATLGLHPTVVQNLPTPQRLVGLPDDAISMPKSLGGFSRQFLSDLDRYRTQGSWKGTPYEAMQIQNLHGYR